MKQAVCVLIPLRQPNFFVAISRRNDTTQWGIPGGKVDPGETSLDAIVRESEEELGVVIDPRKLIPLYSGTCPGEVTYWVTTYLYNDTDIIVKSLKAEEGFEIAAMNMLVLCNPEFSPFANYNREVFSSLSGLT